MDVTQLTGPGGGVLRQGLPTEARIELPKPEDGPRNRAAPVDEVDVGQRDRDIRAAAPAESDAPPADTSERVDITV